MGREKDWVELKADEGVTYDEHDEIDLSKLEPLIACPSSPGNVGPLRKVAGRPIVQAMIGSSANPAMRDFAISAMMSEGKQVQPQVSFDINPASRIGLENITRDGHLSSLIKSGARIHQAGCNGCIGMGQAPATGRISLRTVPRNFPGRSGTKEDQVYLCSPEVATASALRGEITDPRDLGIPYPKYSEPDVLETVEHLTPPPAPGTKVELIMGPNIKPLPPFQAVNDHIEGPTLLKMSDNVSTDEILPAGAKVLPFRSNIPEISKFTFGQIDEQFYERAMPHQKSGFVLVAGENYGQGSSREHAAISPRFLGLQAVIAKSYARIHRKNLINFGVLPLVFDDPAEYEKIDQEDILEIVNVHESLKNQKTFQVKNKTKGTTFTASQTFADLERESVLAGGLINIVLARKK